MITPQTSLPPLIQGGMGVAISTWRLARAVGSRGQLGVVSATAIERVMACRLQEGDVDGHIRRALDAFPDPDLAGRILDTWFQPDGLPRPGGYRPLPMFGASPPRSLVELTVAASFVEVWLAKEGHGGPIGINLLEKIQAPTLPTLYGALLAGVDVVVMGAGIPRDIPAHLDALAEREPCTLRLAVAGGGHGVPFDPAIVADDGAPLRRPWFLAVVSTHVLAIALARSGGVDGYVVEGHRAGGHNAPPRGWDGSGDPRYGPRDEADLDRIRELGLPFWLAGGHASAEHLAAARELGAAGVQIGTPFAFCAESGMRPELRRRAMIAALRGEAEVATEGRGSPTGFPFKVLTLSGTEGGRDPAERIRQPCVLGYLRQPFARSDGSLGWRCPAEPVGDFVAKGGDPAETVGRRCLCNGLLATAGHAHATREGDVELPLMTSGDLRQLERFTRSGEDYDAGSVIAALGL